MFIIKTGSAQRTNEDGHDSPAPKSGDVKEEPLSSAENVDACSFHEKMKIASEFSVAMEMKRNAQCIFKMFWSECQQTKNQQKDIVTLEMKAHL